MPLAFSFFKQSLGSAQKITNIQSWSLETGRQWPTDPYAPMSGTIIARGTPQVKLGEYLFGMVGNVSTPPGLMGYGCFVGYCKDVTVQYGIVAALDVTTYTLEGDLARNGRTQMNGVALAQNYTLAQAAPATSSSKAANGQSIAAAQTYTGNQLDYLNTIILTEMGHMVETGFYDSPPFAIVPDVALYPRNYDVTSNFTISDTTTAAGIRFDQIAFASPAQVYYTQATINPLALASQTAGSGSRAIVQDSYDYSTAQALSHAQYLISQYNTTVSRPYAITASYSNQDTSTRQTEFTKMLNDITSSSGMMCTLEFRSNTYPLIIEGKSITADVSDTTVTLYVSAFDNNNYLILNNAVFGKLDSNKLGF